MLGHEFQTAFINVAIGIAKKTPQNPNIPPNTKTARIIKKGCNFTASENKTGTKTFPSSICSMVYERNSIQNSNDIPNSKKPTIITGIVAIIAPKKGIRTEKPTITDKSAV